MTIALRVDPRLVVVEQPSEAMERVALEVVFLAWAQVNLVTQRVTREALEEARAPWLGAVPMES
jgi:hypothetical protein